MKKTFSLYLICAAIFILTACGSYAATPQPTEAPVPTQMPSVGSTMSGKDGMNLLYVPAGEFTMG